MENKIYRCKICNQIIIPLENPNNSTCVCCNTPMLVLEPKTEEDLFEEKHLPVVTVCCNKVNVKIGKEMHPFTKEHHINWIMLVTNKGKYIKYLDYMKEPTAFFTLCKGEEVKEVYSYCNIHSLYKLDFCKKGNKQ